MSPGLLNAPTPAVPLPQTGDELTQHLIVAHNAAPVLDPETTVAVAKSSNSIDEAAMNAQATAHYGTTTKLANNLNDHPSDIRQRVWPAMTQNERSTVQSLGAVHPLATVGGTSLFGALGDLRHDVAHGLDFLRHNTDESLDQIKGKALDVANAAESPFRALSHFARTEEYIQNQSATAQGDVNSDQQGALSSQSATLGFSPTALKYAFSPSEFAKAWRATNTGATTYFPSALRRLRSQTDPTTLHLAEQIASGVSSQDLLQGLKPSEAQARVASMQTPGFQKVVQELQDSHITPGQSVVGEQFLTDHPVEGHAISGAIDAAFDFYADPTMHTGIVTRGVQAARSGLDAGQLAAYLASNSSEYDDAVRNGLERITQMSRSQRMVSAAVPHLEAGDYDALRRYIRPLKNVAGQLAEAGIKDKAGLEDWLASKAGAKALLEGRAAKIVRGTVLFPGMSPGQGLMSALKGAGSDALEKLSKPLIEGRDLTLANGDVIPVEGTAGDHTALGRVVYGGLASVPRALRRMTTLVPTRGYLDISDPNDSINLRRALQMVLPNHTVSQVMDVYDATKDVGQKFAIQEGVINQMMEMTGLGNTDRGRELLGAVSDTMDDSYRRTAYSVDDLDRMEDSTDPGFRAGILENQLSTNVRLPNFAQIHQAEVAQSVLTRMGIMPADMAHESKIWAPVTRAGVAFMNYWRPFVLMRVGFPVRVVLDEGTEYALRNGVMAQVLPRIALWTKNIDDRMLAKEAVKAADAGAPEQAGFARAIAAHGYDIAPEILDKVRSGRDLASALLGNAAWKAFPASGVSREAAYEAAGIVHDLWDSTNPMIAATHGAQSGGFDQSEELLDYMKDNGKIVDHRMVKNGLYSEATKGEGTFKFRYHQALGTLGESKLGRVAMESLRDGDHPITQMRKVTEALNALPEDLRSMAVRDLKLPDGRMVGLDPGVTRDMAARSWAHKVIAHTQQMLTGTNGELNTDLIDEMLANEGAPGYSVIRDMEDERLPHSAYGPDLVPLPKGRVLISRTMNYFAGMIDHLGRQPMMVHAVARSLRSIRPAVEELMPDADDEVKNELIRNLAWNKAAAELKPFIHSPEYKTQFEVLHRTAAPFLFAQRQFLMRWGRTFAESPEAIARLALLNHGVEVSGFVHQDSQGQETFTYPLSGPGMHIVTQALHALHIPGALPVEESFTGQVRYLIPGISNPITPSVGPGIAVPLKAMTNLFPSLHLEGTENALLQEGASEGYSAQIFPTTLTRMFTAIQAGVFNNVQPGTETASMTIAAMQQLAATGHGLPENATSQQIDQYIRRLNQWAGINLAQKAILGFLVPASPEGNYDPKNYAPRLQQLMNELPYNQALAEFLKENPDANAYTVFASQSDGGASLPATAAAGKWLDENFAFANAHAQAAGWFIPRTVGNGPFDSAVYREQFDIGAAAVPLRQEKSPQQFLQDIQMAPAATIYYKSLDAKDAAIKNVGDNEAAKTEIRTAHEKWLGPFLAQHPVFADYLTSSGEAVQRRDTINDLYSALNAPDLPQGQQTDDVRTMMESFAQFNQDMDSLSGAAGSYSGYTTMNNFSTAFELAGNAFAQAHPDVQDLWNVLLRPTTDAIASGYEDVILPQQPIGTRG